MITITPVSLSATVQVLTAEITESLCCNYCANSSIQPNVSVDYTISSQTLVGTNLYVQVQAVVSATYVPKNGCNCSPKTNLFTEYFQVAFAGATSANSVSLTEALGTVIPANVNCCNIANGVTATNVLTLTMA